MYLPSKARSYWGPPTKPQEGPQEGPPQGPRGPFMSSPSKYSRALQDLAARVHRAACPLGLPCALGSTRHFPRVEGNSIDWVWGSLGGPWRPPFKPKYQGGPATRGPPLTMALEVYGQATEGKKDFLQPLQAQRELGALLGAPPYLFKGPLPPAAQIADLMPPQGVLTKRYRGPLTRVFQQALFKETKGVLGAPGGPLDKIGGPLSAAGSGYSDLLKWHLSRDVKEKISCFLYFNPATEKDLKETIDRWMKALWVIVGAL